jgi:hypothetical protein
VTKLRRGTALPGLSGVGYPDAKPLVFMPQKGGDVMKIRIDALDIPLMFSLVMLALYAFVLGYIFT